jgi:hypothetical protein
MLAAAGPLGPTIDAVARAVGTSRDARRFIDAIAEARGPGALLDAAEGLRVLLLRDPLHPELLAWPPLATLEPVGAGCLLRVAAGRDHLELSFDTSGALVTARPGPSRRLGVLGPALLDGDPGDASALALAVAREADRHLGPLRVRSASPTAAEVFELATAALPSLRRELFSPSTREVNGVAITTVVDGWVGVTSTASEALHALDGAVIAALVSFGSLPTRIPGRLWEAGFHRWARVLGDSGDVAHALLREHDDVVTMIGEEVVDRVDPFRLDGELDAADRDTQGVLAAIPDARPTPSSSICAAYRVLDDAHRRRVPTELAMSHAAPGLPPWQLPSPDDLPWQVVRWRRSPRRR